MSSIMDIADIAAAEVLLAIEGETITYYPLGGGSREIQAVVQRNGIVEVAGGKSPMAMVMTLNDATDGITSAEIDRGGDEIDYPVNIGEATARRKVKEMPSQTAGMIILEVL